MKRVIAFSGTKGGVGRSTLCDMYAIHQKKFEEQMEKGEE